MHILYLEFDNIQFEKLYFFIIWIWLFIWAIIAKKLISWQYTGCWKKRVT